MRDRNSELLNSKQEVRSMRETYFEDLILKDDEKEDEYDEEKGAI